MTPEGKVKVKVRELFSRWGDDIYHFWPVQTGFGSATLDIICCAGGNFFAIETKSKKSNLTDRQCVIRTMMLRAGGVVFRVRNDDELALLEDWLIEILGEPK